MTQADDTNAVDGWIASAKNLKAEFDSVKSMAEEKARVAANVAAHNLSIATIWTFFGLRGGLPPLRPRHASYLNLLNGDVPFPLAFDVPKTMAEILAAAGGFIVPCP